MGEESPGREDELKPRKKWRKIFCFLPLFLVVVAYWGQTLLLEWEGQFGYGQVKEYGLPESIMEQFRLYDSDANGYLDPYEFSVLQQHFNEVS